MVTSTFAERENCMRRTLTIYITITCGLEIITCAIAHWISLFENFAMQEMYTRTLPPLITRISISLSPYFYIIPMLFACMLLLVNIKKKSELLLVHLLGLTGVTSLLIVILKVVGFRLLEKNQEMGGLNF